MYDNVKEKVIGGLRSVDLVALLTDCWTSGATQSYMTWHDHHKQYISDDRETDNPVAQTPSIYEAHRSEVSLAGVLR